MMKYTVGNRAFETYEEAMAYCDMVDFDFHDMIVPFEEDVIEQVTSMETVRAHESSRPEGVAKDAYTVVCAQRPLPGDIVWEGESVGNGVYYAAGDITRYSKVWEQLEAMQVEYMSNDDITGELNKWLAKRNMTMDAALERVDMDTLCGMAKLPQIQ
ncbi:hypothetical protein [Alicyclobacillus acidoterrestris]|uniref:Uncharacterized protein n=1 Tax=Alicyclobacillus acidoterrestris (strain ATCC 49025 / DSM 3922 / CIP 106132 / NCIMB 13137 / GD3B) TaxID=1356854 RepID=T0C3V3_ALIAG|nr:hypothetical protein [Alicyclobacillus acidoterrestris]EPZ47679.1 hypothetical protein N007_05340 [Alicyclobacillus acidoterrestris ATCC 49025]UNO48002.1 hypothetical protein K1I37_15110 [Alicyclobacillus acidoterrestris]